MNNWERMKAGRLYNADSKDLEQYHKSADFYLKAAAIYEKLKGKSSF